MKVTFLGTGTSQGIPVIGCRCLVCTSNNSKDKRLRTSVLVEYLGVNIIIDCGPDFRQQALLNNIESFEAILFTHEHKDHIAGIDDTRPYNYILQRDVHLYGTSSVLDAIKREYHYAFTQEKYPGVPILNLHKISLEPFYIKHVLVTPILVYHHKMPVLGFRIGKFTYITDANFISEEEKNKVFHSKVLVLNAKKHEKHISHFNLSEAIDLMIELQPQKGYFTHISHQLGTHHEVNASLPDFINLAFDGLVLEIED